MTGQEWLSYTQSLINPALDQSLPPDKDEPYPLYRALRYALMAPGKRFRPGLVLAGARWMERDPHEMLPAAVAVEMVHTYSLVHDDLPAMDNDDMRRGRPTVHRAFSEDIAILVGDALLANAFEILAQSPATSRGVVAAVRELGRVAGPQGLVGGQVRDLTYRAELGPMALELMHRAKTGALITLAASLPAILVADRRRQSALEVYGQAVGLAFQITDDILDVVGDAQAMGKGQGRDAKRDKTTYVSFYGLERSRQMAMEEMERAIDAVPGPDGDALRALAQFVVERDR